LFVIRRGTVVPDDAGAKSARFAYRDIHHRLTCTKRFPSATILATVVVMPSIMCAAPLLRRLGYTPPRKRPRDRSLAGVRLGSWGATTFVDDDGADLVLAVDQRTQLAVVFHLEPIDEFRLRFAAALRTILEELGVPLTAVHAETAAIFALPLARLGDAALRESLKTLRFICELELSYHDDLAVVQSNLNEFPHPPPPYVSKVAVASLFAR
jgi:hypothetical protein